MGKFTSTKITSPTDILNRCRHIKGQFFPKTEKIAAVVLDLETTGLDVQNDWAIEVAALFVTGHNGQYQVTHAFHSYLDWIGSGMANPAVFRARLNATNAAMRERDPTVHRMDADTLQALGKSPKLVIPELGLLMTDFFQKMGNECRIAISGHNVFAFDSNFLHHTFAKLGVTSPVVPYMLDTGLIVKAAQIDDERAYVKQGMLLLDWVREVKNIHSRVKWSLNGFCYPTFGIRSLLPDFVLNMPHSSLTDAWSVFAMLQLFDS